MAVQSLIDNHTISFTSGMRVEGPLTPNNFVAPGEVVPFGNAPIAGRPGLTMLNPPANFPMKSPEISGDTYSGVGFVSSGRLSRPEWLAGTPPVETFSLSFDTPGTYEYHCLVHQNFMTGSVEVAAATARDVPGPAEIDAKAQQEIAVLSGLMDRAKAQGEQAQSAPGPSNTSLWFVLAGNTQNQIEDRRVQLLEFLPKDVTVTAGDTVIWSSAFFHSVTFNPTAPDPERFLPEVQPDGSLIAVRNPAIFSPARPTAVFDPTQYYNSTPLGPNPPGRLSWALTFERPGTFEYFCGIHREEGMKGSITVVPRS